LLFCVGLPYGLLASTGPLVQAWFSRAYPERSPYRLYALSNIGSLATLVSYPFFFEPRFDLGTQVALWTATFWLYAALCTVCVAGAWRAQRTLAAREATDEPAPGAGGGATTGLAVAPAPAPAWWHCALWVALPAVASLALLAVTNHVCQDVAPMPLLWVVPLTLYLVTFIIGFDRPQWYHRGALAVLALLAIAVVTDSEGYGSTLVPLPGGIAARLVLDFATLFLMAMLCHRELVRIGPGARYLTAFYLSIAAGGALGGIFVSLVAPQILVTYAEWPLALALSLAIAAGVLLGRARRRAVRVAGSIAAAMGVALVVAGQRETEAPADIARNFYGVISVWEADRGDPARHRFTMFVDGVVHGRPSSPTRPAAPCP
jgi:hypothetical protein